MMISATMPRIAPSSETWLGWTRWKTGPARRPKRMSQRTSGMRNLRASASLAKARSTVAPMRRMASVVSEGANPVMIRPAPASPWSLPSTGWPLRFRVSGRQIVHELHQAVTEPLAAVHGQDVSCDVARLRADQKADRLGDLPGSPEPSQGDPLRDPGDEFGRDPELTVRSVGVDRAGGDRVHSDPESRPLHREGPRQRNDPGFRRGGMDRPGPREPRIGRDEVHD